MKYRPIDFDNLVGQKFVKETLKKAVADDKTVGAYLFCGPRGTGKTSSARIFAKAINCPHTTKGNPCLECDICKDFLEEKLVDIIEIDAASHTGVDNIREIIERAQFAPTKTQYKVYIIDEVHMLSKGAFNALLKILEEPPKHVKFILATTETHKVPETILSRCQRYDFKRISDEDIKNRLTFVAQSETITVDEQSIAYIIKNSGGGLRNALSLFEQLIEDEKIDYSRVVEKMGVVNSEVLDDFLEKLLNRDSSVINNYDELVSEGKNMKLFFKELIYYTKDKALEQLKKADDISSYINILDILDESYSKTKVSLDESTTLLIGVLKIVSHYQNIQDNVEAQPSARPSTQSIGQTQGIAPTQKGDIKEKKTKEVHQEKETVSHDDVFDVFGEEPAAPAAETPVVSSGGFNNDEFIAQLKERGAKGALTMALRGSSLGFSNNTLNIGIKTKIAKGQVTNQDNNTLMLQALESMGHCDATINIVG